MTQPVDPMEVRDLIALGEAAARQCACRGGGFVTFDSDGRPMVFIRHMFDCEIGVEAAVAELTDDLTDL